MDCNRDRILRQMENNVPTECPKCLDRLYFKGMGKYACPRCRKFYYDDFGVIKKYIDENGETPMFDIAQSTGVNLDVVDMLFENGKLDLPKELKDAPRCERCGAFFPGGRYCKACIEETSKGILNVFASEAAQRVKFAKSRAERDNETKNQYEKDKMYYLHDKK